MNKMDKGIAEILPTLQLETKLLHQYTARLARSRKVGNNLRCVAQRLAFNLRKSIKEMQEIEQYAGIKTS